MGSSDSKKRPKLVDEFEATAGDRATSRVPPKPSEVRDEIGQNRSRAAQLRHQAEEHQDVEHRLYLDARVATELSEARQVELDAIQKRLLAVEADTAELDADLRRWDPDRRAKADEVERLKREVGDPVPSDELLGADGEPKIIPPVRVETDPARLAVLREQLAAAEVEQRDLERAHADVRNDRDRLVRSRVELQDAQRVAERQVAAAEERIAELDDLSADRQRQSVAALEEARTLEAQAKTLEAELPAVTAAHEAYVEAHPGDRAQDLGTIVVSVSARERAQAYTEGRREHAAELERVANAKQGEADHAADTSRERLDLAQQLDDRAQNLSDRADASAQRVALSRADADEATTRSDDLQARADATAAEGTRLAAQGRDGEAAVMSARAKALGADAITARFRAIELAHDADGLEATLSVDRTTAAELAQRSAALRAEAQDLRVRSDTLEAEALHDRETAQIADRIADDLAARLDSGQPFRFELVNDREGTGALFDVPAPGPDDPVPARLTAAPAPEVDAISGASVDAGAPLDPVGSRGGAVAEGTTSGGGDFEVDPAAAMDEGLTDLGASDLGASDLGASDLGASDLGASDLGASDLGAVGGFDVGLDVERADEESYEVGAEPDALA